MTNKDKQDVISVCNILADKMSDSGKVVVQQIIGAVEDMVENEPCEDCISLNKLDDVITKAIDESENQTECQTLRWVLDVMSELPSVTPKTVTDFTDKCKECGKIINDKLQTRWIPVSERLPLCEQEVLICTQSRSISGKTKSIITSAIYEDGNMRECYSRWHWEDIEYESWDEEEDCGIIPEGWWEYRHYNPDEVYNNLVDDFIFAWMPLPQPYKAESEEENE